MNNAKPSTPPTLDRLTHDIVNQLTVISLCSSELRHSVAEKLEPDQLEDFRRLEDAVAEAAEIIRQLRAALQNHAHPVKLQVLNSSLSRLGTLSRLSPLLSRLTFLP